jgi:hypothetical protein
MDPMCAMQLDCAILCVKNGGDPLQCVMSCGPVTPPVVNAGLCVQQNCGKGICL